MNEKQIREWQQANKRAVPPLVYVRPGAWFKKYGTYHLYGDCSTLEAVENRDDLKWSRGIVSASEASARKLLCCRPCERRRMAS